MAMTTTGYTITNPIRSWLFFCLYKEDRGQVKIKFWKLTLSIWENLQEILNLENTHVACNQKPVSITKEQKRSSVQVQENKVWKITGEHTRHRRQKRLSKESNAASKSLSPYKSSTLAFCSVTFLQESWVFSPCRISYLACKIEHVLYMSDMLEKMVKEGPNKPSADTRFIVTWR